MKTQNLEGDVYRRFVEKLELRYFFYRHDLDGVFTYVSPSISQVLGYTPDQFMRHYATYMTDSPINSEVERHTNLCIQGIQQPPYLVEIKHRNGSIRLLQVAESPFRNAAGRVEAVEGIAEDITEWQETRIALEASHRGLKALIDSAPLAIVLLDLKGAVLSWNGAAERIFGWTAEEAIGRSHPIIPPGKEEEFQALLKLITSGETVLSVERTRVRKDGSTVEIAISATPWRNPDGSVSGCMAYIEDITARKRSIEEMCESELRFRTIFEHLNDAALLADIDSGRILDANERAERLFDRPRAEIMGMHQSELHPPASRERHRAVFNVHSTTDHSLQTPAEILRSDGAIIPIEISASTMTLGGRRAILGLFRDMTERHRAEEEMKRLYEGAQSAREQAEAALRTRDAFVQIAAHDLKTPLGAMRIQIEGMCRAEKDNQLSPGMVRKGLSLLDRQTDRLSRLVHNLLELALISSGRIELEKSPCDLGQIVRSTCERLGPSLEQAHCHLDCAIGAHATGIWDHDRIEEVVENLLSNAIKYGAGHPVRMEVSADPQRVRLTISDQGHGIPDDQQDRIFDRFERGTSAQHYGGMGLGLYIAKMIVEEHAGSIRVRSIPRQGTSFIVELPRDRSA